MFHAELIKKGLIPVQISVLKKRLLETIRRGAPLRNNVQNPYADKVLCPYFSSLHLRKELALRLELMDTVTGVR